MPAELCEDLPSDPHCHMTAGCGSMVSSRFSERLCQKIRAIEHDPDSGLYQHMHTYTQKDTDTHGGGGGRERERERERKRERERERGNDKGRNENLENKSVLSKTKSQIVPDLKHKTPQIKIHRNPGTFRTQVL